MARIIKIFKIQSQLADPLLYIDEKWTDNYTSEH